MFLISIKIKSRADCAFNIPHLPQNAVHCTNADEKRNGNENHILQDIAIIILSVLVAVLLGTHRCSGEYSRFGWTNGDIWRIRRRDVLHVNLHDGSCNRGTGEISLLQGIFYTALLGAAEACWAT